MTHAPSGPARMLAIASLVLALFAAAACGEDDSGVVDISDAQFRIAPNGLGAGYLTISNGTDDPITLQGASSPEVERIELHESEMIDGVMQMSPRPEGFTVEPGQEVVLEPGGKHLMLFSPEPTGEVLELTLDFGGEQLTVAAEFDEEASVGHDDMDMDSTGMGEPDSMDSMESEEEGG